MRLRRSAFSSGAFLLREENMGIGSELKKGFKKIGKLFFSPWGMLGPLGMGIGFFANEQKAVRDKMKQDQQLQALDEKSEDDSAEIEFRNELEKRRRGSKGSDVIFAGILGPKSREGLGGQKTLLGL